jgi:hypothetical protein
MGKPREVSDHRCECGCGEFTLKMPQNLTAKGWVRGEPFRFVNGHQMRWKKKPDPNPEQKCFCGCGGDTGSPSIRYLKSHQLRKSPVDYVVQDDGCWAWQRAFSAKGYGICLDAGKLVHAHRWVWEKHRGPLTSDVELHHSCENRWCVNPDHLEPLSKAEHAARHWELRRAA